MFTRAPTPPSWNGGKTITLATAGDGVPAFSISLTAPVMPLVSMPEPSNDAIIVKRADGLTLAWAARTANVRLRLEPDPAG